MLSVTKDGVLKLLIVTSQFLEEMTHLHLESFESDCLYIFVRSRPFLLDQLAYLLCQCILGDEVDHLGSFERNL